MRRANIPPEGPSPTCGRTMGGVANPRRQSPGRDPSGVGGVQERPEAPALYPRRRSSGAFESRDSNPGPWGLGVLRCPVWTGPGSVPDGTPGGGGDGRTLRSGSLKRGVPWGTWAVTATAGPVVRVAPFWRLGSRVFNFGGWGGSGKGLN